MILFRSRLEFLSENSGSASKLQQPVTDWKQNVYIKQIYNQLKSKTIKQNLNCVIVSWVISAVTGRFWETNKLAQRHRSRLLNGLLRSSGTETHIKQADTRQNTCLQSHLSGNDIQSPFNFPPTEQSFEFALTFRRSCFLWTHLELFLICRNKRHRIPLCWQNCGSLHPKECSEDNAWPNPLNCNLNRCGFSWRVVFMFYGIQIRK